MTEQEAFRKAWCEYKFSGGTSGADAEHFWNKRGEYEAERVEKLVKALKSIATGRDADGAKVDFFQDIAAEALREYQGGE